jgi:hypothetical protein
MADEETTDTTAQERYFNGLMERVREDRYPSIELLDRIEAAFWTSEQVVDYVDMLLEKLEDSWYPSKQIMDRIQRLLAYTAAVG